LRKLSNEIKYILPSFVVEYFTKGVDRSNKVRKNIFFSFFFKGLSIIISLLLVPLTIQYINPTRYGIWLTLTSIISWISFFDVGFGNGLRNKFDEAIAKGKYKLARIYLSTTYAILSIIIGGVLIVFLLINPFLNWSAILNTDPSMAGELSALALVVFAFFCIQFVLQLIVTVMIANQQPARGSLINFLGNFFSLILVYILTRTTSGNLVAMGSVLSLAPVVVLAFFTYWLYKHNYRKYSPALRFVNFKFAGGLMDLGLKFFIIQLSAILLFQTNNIIISQLMGPEHVTPYNIAFKYFGSAQMIFVIILSPFWSAYTDAYVRKDLNWIKRTTRKLVRCWVFLLILVLVMLLISPFVYDKWVGDSVHVSKELSLACAIYVMIICWSSIFVNFVNGVGKIKLQLIFSIFISFINIPLSLLLITKTGMGILGLVYSNCICLAAGAILITIQYQRIINNRDTGIWSK
jgi:O-antigen/teichoic acid export membrane protein